MNSNFANRHAVLKSLTNLDDGAVKAAKNFTNYGGILQGGTTVYSRF